MYGLIQHLVIRKFFAEQKNPETLSIEFLDFHLKISDFSSKSSF